MLACARERFAGGPRASPSSGYSGSACGGCVQGIVCHGEAKGGCARMHASPLKKVRTHGHREATYLNHTEHHCRGYAGRRRGLHDYAMRRFQIRKYLAGTHRARGDEARCRRTRYGLPKCHVMTPFRKGGGTLSIDSDTQLQTCVLSTPEARCSASCYKADFFFSLHLKNP